MRWRGFCACGAGGGACGSAICRAGPSGGGCDLEREIVQVGCGTVVGGEQDALPASAQDEKIVGPCEQLGASPQGLSGTGAAVLAGVMDEQDGGAAAALQLAQAVEDGCDLADGVFVGAMQADQGVEDEQVHPVVPEIGSVGASGDLGPLAHIALALIGEGRAETGGEEGDAGELLARAGIPTLELPRRRGSHSSTGRRP